MGYYTLTEKVYRSATVFCETIGHRLPLTWYDLISILDQAKLSDSKEAKAFVAIFKEWSDSLS